MVVVLNSGAEEGENLLLLGLKLFCWLPGILLERLLVHARFSPRGTVPGEGQSRGARDLVPFCSLPLGG